ncbi:MFS transporter [Flavobacterium sp.]|uniref:MFS transporter n=1 Tax=Flavobacterium sp. TaxID=239 RepID=UPI002B733145|nr:MFS transporter [Flavobacterium sp.]HSD08138.1 MFS transporter [Flavobacterium sp.]
MSTQLDYSVTVATEYHIEQKSQKVVTDYFDSVEVNFKQKLIIFLLAFGLFFDFMDTTNFSIVTPFLVKTWNITLDQVGYINASFFIGMFLGGILGGYLANHFGRKPIILGSIFLFSVASVCNGFSNGYLSFLILRLFTGIGSASLIVVANLYLAEILPNKSRGRWLSLVFGLGFLAVPLISIINKYIAVNGDDAWRILYFLGGLGIVAFALGLVYIKESPRWLVTKERVSEAESIIKNLTGYEADLSGKTNKSATKVSVIEVIKEIFKKNHIRKTGVLMSIFWLGYPSYLTLIYWLPVLFSQKGFSLEDTNNFSVFFAVSLSIAPYFAALISDWGGRKWVIVALYALAALFAVIYGQLETKTIIFIFASLLLFAVQSVTPITSTYLTELYPTHLRSSAVGFIYSISRLFVAFVQLLIAKIIAGYGQIGVFIYLGFTFIVPAILVAIWGIKTSGQSLEAIEGNEIQSSN